MTAVIHNRPGPKSGYKQSPEHLAKRIKRGTAHPNWKGDKITRATGHGRALRRYRSIGPCTRCGKPATERHHRDDNTANNEPSNIAILCRTCHMQVDGRLTRLQEARRRSGHGYRGQHSDETIAAVFALRADGLSQSGIGRRLGMGQSHVSRVLNGKRRARR